MADILKSVYTSVWTLENWLLERGHIVASDADEEGFWKWLQSHSVCSSSSCDVMRSLSFNQSLSCFSASLTLPTTVLIRQVVEILLERGEDDNVLVHGYKRRMEHAAPGDRTDAALPNSSVVYFSRKPWRLLHRRIGDREFGQLLASFSLFVASANECVVQLAGVPWCPEKVATEGKCVVSGCAEVPALAPTSVVPVEKQHRQVRDRKHAADYKIWSSKVLTLRPIVFRTGAKRCHFGWLLKRFKDFSYDDLLRAVFPDCLDAASEFPARAALLLKQLLKRLRSISFRKLLDHYCSPPGDYGSEGGAAVDLHSVYRFMESVLRKVVPMAIVGSRRNWRTLQLWLKTFVRLGMYDRLPVRVYLSRIKLSDCKWLYFVAGHVRRQTVLAQLYYWLFSNLLLDVAKAAFYLTTTRKTKNKLFYYRHDVWATLSEQAITELIQQRVLEQQTAKAVSVVARSSAHLQLTYCLRFVPKLSGVRPIAVPSKILASQRSILRDLLAILRYCMHKHRLAGFTPGASRQDVLAAWTDFKKALKSQRQRKASGFYIVQADIKGCYESIVHDKLKEVLQGLFKHCRGPFVIRQFASLLVSGGRHRRVFHRVALQLHDVAHSGQHPDWMLPPHWPHEDGGLLPRFARRVVAEQRSFRPRTYSCSDVLSLLDDVISATVLELRGQSYRLLCGVPQGSELSRAFCDAYYSDMETRLGLTASPCELLLRTVDDYLFITRSEPSAVRFLSILEQGISHYNCHINMDKTRINFDAPHSRVIRTTGTDLIWCGHRVDAERLGIGLGLPCSVTDVLCSMTFNMEAKPKQYVLKSLARNMKQLALRLYFDDEINDDITIYRSLYTLFFTLAAKYHHYRRRLLRDLTAAASIFWAELIATRMPSQLWHHVKRRLHAPAGASLADVNSEEPATLLSRPAATDTTPLSKDEMKWLCIRAFVTVLKKQRTVHQHILKQLRGRCDRLSSRLLPVTIAAMKFACTAASQCDRTRRKDCATANSDAAKNARLAVGATT